MRTVPQLVAPLAVGAAVILVAAGLSGCARISDAAHKQHEEVFATYREAKRDWTGPDIPRWIPSDATDIRSLATTNLAEAMVRVDTDSALPKECEEAERKNLPYSTRDWAPDIGLPDTVERCGSWEVVATDDGWFAWFHAHSAGDMPTG